MIGAGIIEVFIPTSHKNPPHFLPVDPDNGAVIAVDPNEKTG